MLLGPAYPGYVCTGHWGCVGGRREEACLSIHGALDDVARGVAVGKKTLTLVQDTAGHLLVFNKKLALRFAGGRQEIRESSC